MPLTYWLTVAALASPPFAAGAQQLQMDPSNANAPVPGAAYESALKNYQPAADEQQSPDKTWRAANEQVRKIGGHVGHMQDDATTSSASAPAQAMPADHGKHH